MKRVYKKSYLIILAAIIAVCCAVAAVFAGRTFAHADVDNAEKIYWGVDYGSLYISEDETEVEDSEHYGSFSNGQVFATGAAPWYKYRNDIEDVTLSISEISVTSTARWFEGLANIEYIDISGLDFSSVTNMSGMFSDCSSLTDLDLSDLLINKANVTHAEGMLSGLTALESITIDENMADILSRFDTGLARTLYIECKAYAPSNGLYAGLKPEPEAETETETYTTTPAEHVLNFVEVVEANCTEPGNVAHYICDVCEKTFEDEEGLTEIANVTIPADPTKHDWQTVDRVEPTQTEVGYTEHQECSICGETQGKEEIPATGKTPGTGTGTGSGSGSTNSGTNNTNISDKTILIVLSFGVGLVLLMAIFALILAIKKRRVKGRKDDDGFYDPYYGSY